MHRFLSLVSFHSPSSFLTMSAFPTLSSSTPMSDWFANITLLHSTVQQQAATIRMLQDRIVVLESRANIQYMESAANAVTSVAVVAKKARKPRKPKTESSAALTTESSVTKAAEGKKRGRKPADVNLSEFLREGEQVIARIPLGDRRFDEHAVTVRDGKLVTESDMTFDHPTTLVAALAHMLEDIGERSSECSKSLNGWLLCTVSRDGKRVPLEKLKPSTGVPDAIGDASEEVAEAADATLEVA